MDMVSEQHLQVALTNHSKPYPTRTFARSPSHIKELGRYDFLIKNHNRVHHQHVTSGGGVSLEFGSQSRLSQYPPSSVFASVRTSPCQNADYYM